MTSNIKRSLVKTFINTTPAATATWALINLGVTSAKEAMGPKITKEVYIHEDIASQSVDSYGPSLPVDMGMVKEDAALVYLDAKRRSAATLSDAETELLHVYLYKGSAGGLYLAYKQRVAMKFEDVGGDAAKQARLSTTFLYMGESEAGTFDPAGLEFVGTPATARLSSLVIDGVTLSPAFKPNRIWYAAATTDATDDITAESVDVGAVVAIDVDGDTVVSGAAATWVEGLNVVTITVTVGADVSTYIVLVTATLGA